MCDKKRRLLLKSSITLGTLGVAISAGLLIPSAVLASWPKKAFEATNLSNALSELFQSTNTTESNQILIDSPDFAENGAKVPVTVKVDIPNIDSVTLMVSKNETPLTSIFKFYKDMQGHVSTRVKFKETADLVAVVKANDQLFTAKKRIQVSIGGCSPTE